MGRSHVRLRVRNKIQDNFFVGLNHFDQFMRLVFSVWFAAIILQFYEFSYGASAGTQILFLTLRESCFIT